ncbi:MAG: thrombospondin type 3 repeat-containing protein [Patescibacteria group bacterium]|jgi:hypothetical protein
MDGYNDNDFKEEENLNQNQDLGQNLGKNQKIAVGVLAVSAILVIILWTAQLKNSINSPFSYNLQNSSTNGSSALDANSAEVLQTKDTDNDGLTDWDELNTYQTSPYLEDSDSDGFTDGEEINKGTDPNCPAGRTCSSDNTSTTSSIENNSATSTSTNLNLDLDKAINNSSPTQEEDLQKMLSGGSDVSALRKMLIEAGMDEEMLSEISDEDLMASYQKTLQGE